MLLGKVVGTCVATRKDEKLQGMTMLVVQQIDASGKNAGGVIVAIDSVGAGVGETVLFATGSSARQTQTTQNKPVDAVIMAIVDTIDVNS
ncbi:MAG: EutN/CcmL family microcompartment protein [Oligoflexia bacterium]|nr:EutN/CcmL family microcompartment protein [Oligoflexia bacterium]